MAAFDGLKATAAEQTASAISAIKTFYLYVPIAIWVIMFIIAACYKLDKMYDKMMRELIPEKERTGWKRFRWQRTLRIRSMWPLAVSMAAAEERLRRKSQKN